MTWKSFAPTAKRALSSSTLRWARQAAVGETSKTPVHNDQGEVVVFWRLPSTLPSANTLKKLSAAALNSNNEPPPLRAVLDAASGLIQIQDLDTLCRAGGTGPDNLISSAAVVHVRRVPQLFAGHLRNRRSRRTTDERGAQREAGNLPPFSPRPEQLLVVRETPHVYVQDGVQQTIGAAGGRDVCAARGAAGYSIQRQRSERPAGR